MLIDKSICRYDTLGMIYGENPVTLFETLPFYTMLDEACERLMETQARHSIQRIQKMEQCLAGLEQELDEFLNVQMKKNAALRKLQGHAFHQISNGR